MSTGAVERYALRRYAGSTGSVEIIGAPRPANVLFVSERRLRSGEVPSTFACVSCARRTAATRPQREGPHAARRTRRMGTEGSAPGRDGNSHKLARLDDARRLGYCRVVDDQSSHF